MTPVMWTIGHSTRALDEFLTLLSTHGIQYLIDVRRYPFSRRYPHFNGELLATSLRAGGLAYTHAPRLGGRRKARPDSVNLGWRNESFRGYADYMATEDFQRSLDQLIADSRSQPTAVMCAEAVPWRCHRLLIADALVARGLTVNHILSQDRAEIHTLAAFARIIHDRLTYPLPTTDPELPRLF